MKIWVKLNNMILIVSVSFNLNNKLTTSESDERLNFSWTALKQSDSVKSPFSIFIITLLHISPSPTHWPNSPGSKSFTSARNKARYLFTKKKHKFNTDIHFEKVYKKTGSHRKTLLILLYVNIDVLWIWCVQSGVEVLLSTCPYCTWIK